MEGARLKTALLTAPRSFEVTDAERPEPGAGEVLVRVRNTGVCGTDLHFFRGEFPVAPGFCLGHEVAGEVAGLGAGVDGFAPGDRVALELFQVCQVCPQCRTGNYHLCAKRGSYGLTVAGGLREYMTVPAYALYRLPDEVDFELGALVEPLAVGVHGLRLVDLRFGDRVAVLGAGTIGLLAVAAAREMGATYVAATARHPQQKATAEAVGADAVFDATAEGVRALSAAVRGADVVVETVGGRAETLGEALQVAGTGGRICLLGAFTAPVQIHPMLLLLKEARIVGSNCYGRSGAKADYELAIEIMRRNAERLRPIITHRFALDDVAEAYSTADDKSTGAIKVTIAQ
jgi:(R,R)-butanediol dehydrogenase/meso-butanediol dehydrogenase/diacetyl reductase/L-iditol 2-dehydrogenase